MNDHWIVNDYLARTKKRILDSFWSCVNKTETCWLWTGTKDEFGYGRPRIGGRQIRAHRFSYELVNGRISDPTFVVRHTCDVPACVNPSHLILGTKLDNARDRDARGRNGVMGENNPHAKLTEDQVREIRREWTGAYGQASALCRKYGIKAPALYAIIRRTGWRHIE